MFILAWSVADYPLANQDNSSIIQGEVAIIDVLSNDVSGVGTLLLYKVSQVCALK
jgi:hypothetical protein